MLSVRKQEILKILYNSQVPVTAKRIAELNNVSVRTIQYDLRDLTEWAASNGIDIKTKPHVGVTLNNREKVKEFIDIDGSKTRVYATNDERYNMTLIMLLQSYEPLKTTDLADNFFVSKSTVLHDLGKIENELKDRKVGYTRDKNGFLINIDEKSRRKIIMDVIYSNINKQRLVEYFFQSDYFLLNDNKNHSINKFVNNLVDNLDTDDIKNRISIIESKLSIKITDLSYAGIIMHIALSIERLKMNKPIQLDKEELSQLKKLDEYKVVTNVLMPLEDLYAIKLDENEVAYLVLHILGAQLTEVESINKDDMSRKLVDLIFEEVELEYGVNLNDNYELKNNLFVHVKPAVLRIKYDVSVINPELETIKKDYHRSYIVCQRAAQRFNRYYGTDISDDEVGYLVIYIELGLEHVTPHKKMNLYRAIVVCGMGIGSSKILTNRIETEFSNIRVVDQLSIKDINDYNLSDIDIVISTVDMSVTLSKPVIVINPILTQEDIRRIVAYFLSTGYSDIQLSQYSKMLNIIDQHCTINNKEQLEQDLMKLLGLNRNTDLSQNLMDVLLPECCQINLKASNWEEAVTKASEPLVKYGYIKDSYVEEIIRHKNKYDHYFLIGDSLSMPHASPKAGVLKIGVALAVLDEPILVTKNNKKVEIKIILVLAAIDNNQHSKVIMDIAEIFNIDDVVEKIEAVNTSSELYSLLQDISR
ncbi:BglG family transcription antiterminator [Vibrio sp. JC009]|uniref:BglG family transcription antiterminator n=1 Tax=Vibrio sp. JC009 TaxID=2912314 RepID=UPI0023B1F345|nr:BglG family transcription antiterminator [Vibrio sp. JC009]WED23446.1 BglG family transcription antiterminator [Vibrio sp. JC009]